MIFNKKDSTLEELRQLFLSKCICLQYHFLRDYKGTSYIINLWNSWRSLRSFKLISIHQWHSTCVLTIQSLWNKSYPISGNWKSMRLWCWLRSAVLSHSINCLISWKIQWVLRFFTLLMIFILRKHYVRYFFLLRYFIFIREGGMLFSEAIT